MCWRLSVFLFGGREGHWNTKNRFIKDKNNLLPGGFTQSELCCVAWLNHFSREARGSLCCFEGKGQGDAAGHRISEREREGFWVCWGSTASTCVPGWHSPLGRGSPQAVPLGSLFGHSLERQVGEGNTELFCANPFHLPHGRKIALDHSHEMYFSLKRVCRKAVLSWSAFFCV